MESINTSSSGSGLIKQNSEETIKEEEVKKEEPY